jgi:hypothetical protein
MTDQDKSYIIISAIFIIVSIVGMIFNYIQNKAK